MKIDTRNIKPATIIRTLVLATGLINLALTMFGKTPLPFGDDDIAEFVAYLWAGGSAAWAWWKNNSITEHAILADEHKEALKASEILAREVIELPEELTELIEEPAVDLQEEEPDPEEEPEDDEEEIPEEDYDPDEDDTEDCPEEE